LCEAATYDDAWGKRLRLAPRGGEVLVTRGDPNRDAIFLRKPERRS
jgi:hypothetical protein